MILLGDRYKFTEIELKVLNRKFQEIKYINDIQYKIEDEIIKTIEEGIKEKKRGLIVLNISSQIQDKLLRYLTHLELDGVSYLTIEHFLEKYLKKCYIPDDQTDISFLDNIKPYSKWQYIQKRAIDYFGIFWLFLFSWPIMLYSIYRIKKESPDGEVFFKQKRVGLNGQEFVCIKFRSMKPDAENGTPKFASENDPRIFQWGETMRRYRLDELPQIANILKGEMHLIGPRPERRYWIEQFEKLIPYYNERHLVKPGITGWAQVNYPYGQNLEDTKQKLMYDLYYIKHWNIWLELKIVWQTAMTVINKKGL